MSGGQAKVPVVFRTQGGPGRSSAAQHAQSLEAWFHHLPGLLVAMPSTPYDAKGLLKTAIRLDDPVMFIEQKLLYNMTGPVPEEEYTIPFGVADVKREGTDCTVVATSMAVVKALRAAELLEEEGISVEVIDPRTLFPLDIDDHRRIGVERPRGWWSPTRRRSGAALPPRSSPRSPTRHLATSTRPSSASAPPRCRRPLPATWRTLPWSTSTKIADRVRRLVNGEI